MAAETAERAREAAERVREAAERVAAARAAAERVAATVIVVRARHQKGATTAAVGKATAAAAWAEEGVSSKLRLCHRRQ